MERWIVFFVLIIMSIGFVFADSDWGDVVLENDENDSFIENTQEDELENYVRPPVVAKSSGTAKKIYTRNFYFALGLGVFAILLILYMIFVFIRGPNEKWGPGVIGSREVSAPQNNKKKFSLFKKKILVKEVGTGSFNQPNGSF